MIDGFWIAVAVLIGVLSWDKHMERQDAIECVKIGGIPKEGKCAINK